MSKIHFERFDKLLKFLPKSKIKAGDGQDSGKYPFFKSGNDQSKFIDTAIFEGESLIIGDGGSANINFYDKKFSASDHCYVIQKDNQSIDVKYVYYYLKSNLQILEAGFKGAGLKNISKKYISEIKIPLLPLQDQQKIAGLLTQIEELINKREESIKLLDELIKSTFLDMFGDPYLNVNNFQIKKLSEVTKLITDGTHKTPLYKENGVMFLSAKNIKNNQLIFDDVKYISEEEHNQLIQRCKPEFNDILLTKSGSIGMAAIIPKLDFEFSTFESLCLIKFDKKIINSIYLREFLNSEATKYQYKKHTKGIAIKHLHLVDVRKLKIPLAPKPLQDKFADIVNQIENTKTIYQNSLIELNNLFGSIAQKAFKGELDVSKIEQIQKSTNILESQEKIIENKVDYVDTDNNPIFSKEFVKMLINQAGQLTNEKLMNTIKQYSFKDKVSFDDIKKSVIELIENKDIEQIVITTENISGFDKEIGFRIRK